MKKFVFLLAILTIALQHNLFAQSNSATYSLGAIPTTYNTSPQTTSNADDPGSLTVIIPADAQITGVDVQYDFTSFNGAWISEQRSFLRCISPGGVTEPAVVSGSGTEGTYQYNRTNLNIANDVTGGGEIQFELHAFRTWGGSGSNTEFSYVNDNTWTITIHYLSSNPLALPPQAGNGSSDEPYQISSLANLFWIAEDSSRWGYHYIQTADIDAYDTYNWFEESGWLPIGIWFSDTDPGNTPFTGSYNGQFHTVDGLFTNRPDENGIGMFGFTENAFIENLGVTNLQFTGFSRVGGLAGMNILSTINNCFTSGYLFSSASQNDPDSYIGGFVGYNQGTPISNSFSTADVDGYWYAGGFIGTNSDYDANGSPITNCYSHGAVEAMDYAGTFIGENSASQITNCYTAGYITYMGEYVNGFLGFGMDSDITGCYWDIDATDLHWTSYAESRTTDEMTHPYAVNTYVGWDFENVWGEDEYYDLSLGYPYLWWQDPPDEFTLTIDKTGEGTVTVAGEEITTFPFTSNYPQESIIELAASPSLHWDFQKWVINEVDVFDEETSLILDENKNIAVHFSQLPPLPAAALYPLDEETGVPVDFEFSWEAATAGPEPEGYLFRFWAAGETEPGPEDVGLTTSFWSEFIEPDTQYFWEVIPYILTDIGSPLYAEDCPIWSFTTLPAEFVLSVDISGTGSISVNEEEVEQYPSTYYYYDGTTVFLSAIPAPGWAFQKWVINEADIFEQNTEILMDENKTVTAHFTEILPPLAAIAPYPADEALNVEIDLTFQWSPNPAGPAPDGYLFGYWIDDDEADIMLIDLEEAVTYEVPENLQYNTQYVWQVIPYVLTAEDSKIEAEDCPVWTFTTAAPVLNPPQNLSATAGNNSVWLEWDTPETRYGNANIFPGKDPTIFEQSSVVLSGYNIYRNGSMINPDLVIFTEYEDNTAINGETYEYYVTALYDEGESEPSNTVIVTMPPANTPPVVSNVHALQRDDGSMIFDIYYDVDDEDGDELTITMEVSADDGESWNVSCEMILPDSNIGPGVFSGENKHIAWDAGTEHPGIYSENFRFKITADDGFVPIPEMVFVQGTEGVTFSPGGEGYFTPGGSYNVSLSDFYIGKYEVTQGEYLAVMGVTPGGSNSSIGDPLDHPINNVSWFNAIEYCNRLSMMEGLTPAYSYSTNGTNPDNWPAGWNTSNANHTNVSCNWSANGYRLPTEMEREYAARGGVPAATAIPSTFNDLYAGTNIEGTGPGQLGDYAWYWENNSPWGTKPVGTKLPNELGLYDMSGNVWNWVWDIYGSYPSVSFTDPTGPVSGYGRMRRGGDWLNGASHCAVSYRNTGSPTYTLSAGGFRVSRNVPIETVAAPTFTPPGGLYEQPQTVTIISATNGALIYYTTDESEPTEASFLYEEPITISVTTTLKARAYKEGWNHSGVAAEVYTIETASNIEMVFVQGTAGVTFSPGGYGYFTPGGSYNVSLSSFYISRFAVTQAKYLAVMGVNPGGSNSSIGDPLDHPINNVSWFNAIEYCNRLSMMEGLTPTYSYSTNGTNPDNWPPGWNTSNANHTNVSCNWSANGYRLPTEMEREFAARGGVPAQNAGTFNNTYAGTNVDGTGPGQLGDYAWYRANAGWDLPGGSSHPDYGTHPVGTKLPNELGLYDMSGNVWNWGWDIWSSSYPSGFFTDPTGPVSGSYRVARGGSWYSYAIDCTVSDRNLSNPTSTYGYLGFRVCRVSP